MERYHRSDQRAPLASRYLALSTALILAGCASPAPPRAPSLHLPQLVRDLTAIRTGNSVELHFTAPANSTDKLPLRGPALSGQLCRQLPHQPCLPVSPRSSVPITNSPDTHNLVTWTDTLPPSLTTGDPQLLIYRVEFFSSANRSAGPSNQAFTASGPAPAAVENLQATGSRLGIVLQWTPSQTIGSTVLRRESLAPAAHPKTPPVQWLQTNDPTAPNSQPSQTLDTTALPDTPYRYSAQRRTTLHLAGHTIELRSDLTPPIIFKLLQLYPPPTPTGLTAAGFFTGEPSRFAVDLIWQPIDEAGLITRLAGYNLYRQPLDASGHPTASPTQLNPAPLPQPAFHDTTATPSIPYQYSVTAVDIRGNQSPATTVTLQPTPAP